MFITLKFDLLTNDEVRFFRDFWNYSEKLIFDLKIYFWPETFQVESQNLLLKIFKQWKELVHEQQLRDEELHNKGRDFM